MFKPPVLFFIVAPDGSAPEAFALENGLYKEGLDGDGYPVFVLHTIREEAEEALREAQKKPADSYYASGIDFSKCRVIRYEPIVDAVPEK
jgi:hypothetical protein